MNPANLIDFTRWRLQLPVDTAHAGSPADQYEKAELAAGFQVSPWFVALDALSATQFRANVEGTTTSSNTIHPRSELREMSPTGTTTIQEWSSAAGLHTMEVRLSVSHLPVVKPQVVCAQVHATTDDLVQILCDADKIKWRWRGVTQAEILINPYVLGTIFTLRLELEAGTFRLYVNGTLAATRTGAVETQCYFKTGSYVQSSLSEGDAAGAYGEVLVYGNPYVFHSTETAPTGVYRRNRSVANTGVSGTSTVLQTPVGVKQNDRMYALVASIATTPTITPPAGWTQIGADYNPGSTLKTSLWYRDVGASAEPLTYTWTWSGNGRTEGMCVAYAGMDLTAAPLGGVVGATDSSVALSTFAFSAPQAGDWAFFAGVGRQNPGDDAVKTWAITGGTADVNVHDAYSPNTGTGADLTFAWWDTGAPLAAGAVTRSVDPSVVLTQYHAWAMRLAAPAPPPDPEPPPGFGTWSYIGVPHR